MPRSIRWRTSPENGPSGQDNFAWSWCVAGTLRRMGFISCTDDRHAKRENDEGSEETDFETARPSRA